MKQPEHYAVLTGDIIKSRRLSPKKLESVRDSLMNAVAALKQWKRGLVRGNAEFFRGDAWQLLLTNPVMALRAGLFLRASVLAGGVADSRVAVGLGQIESISARRISLSTGEAFVLSGRALDGMTQHSRMSIELPQSVGPLSDWVRVVGHLCDAFMGQWTQRQSEVVCAAIHPKEPAQEEVAQMLKPQVSRQAVTKALDGANWRVVREAVHVFEDTDWNSVLRLKKG